ncbi:hypothetical protein HDK77DRAFT_198168 [Phyllosticta capitalensis]
MLCSFRYNSFSVVDSMIRDLERWYAELPESIKLPLPDPDSNKNHDDPSEQFDLDTRATINFLHLIYRGNIILLCRRFLTHEPSAGSAYSEQFRELRRRYSKQAISAALEASRIMKDIRKQEGIYDRCWLIFSQAYNSCTVLLFAVAESFSQDEGPNNPAYEYLDAAQICLDTLTKCAKGDKVARLLHSRVEGPCHFWKNMVRGPPSVVPPSPQATHSSGYSSSSSETRSTDLEHPFAEIVRLIQLPFVDGGEAPGFETWGSGVATNVTPPWNTRHGDSVCTFEWKLAAVIPFNWVCDWESLES